MEDEEKGEKAEQPAVDQNWGLQSDTSLFQHKKTMVPLVAPDKPKRPSFVGEAYSEITDAGYYKISDVIGRN